MSGGIDPAAFHRPKRFFGAARNLEEGGSLTILATALIDTGSRMDEVIYEELKELATWNCIWIESCGTTDFPALDIRRSGTRKEELLIPADQLEKLWAIRKTFSDSHDFTERFLKKFASDKNKRRVLR